jgi:hypothetical protein
MLPNTGVRLLGVSILLSSLSTDCDLVKVEKIKILMLIGE